MIQPLSSSSVIDLVAPGSPVTRTNVRRACQQVEALGFQARSQVVFSPSASVSQNDPKQKFQQLKKALLSADSQAIWCVRGGYGSQKLMPFLLRMQKPKKPKLLIGYSDVTVLQVFLNLKWQWPALHFPVLTQLGEASPQALRDFIDLLTGTKKQQDFKSAKILNPWVVGGARTMRQTPPSRRVPPATGKLDATSIFDRDSVLPSPVGRGRKPTGKVTQIGSTVTGGNLTLIQSSIGTAWAGSFQNKILFLEDTGESPYRVDRALWQMQKAGVFKGVKALLLGDFICPQSHPKQEMQKVLSTFASQVSFPVVQGVPLGHGDKKSALPFMTSCVLDLSPSGKAQCSVNSPCYTQRYTDHT